MGDRGSGDEELDEGGMTDLEDVLNALRDEAEIGDEQAEEQMPLLSEFLVAQQRWLS